MNEEMEELFSQLSDIDNQLCDAIYGPSGANETRGRKLAVLRESLMLKIKVFSNCKFTGDM